MIRFILDVTLGLMLMTAGYALTRIGRWMQGKPRRPHRSGGVYTAPPRPVVVFYPGENVGWLQNSPELAEMLGRKMSPREELN